METNPQIRRRTLEELEGVEWGEPSFRSGLVVKCHELRKKPIGDLTVEELRLLVLQQIGLPFLVPVALAIVEQTPLAEGDCYPGDLLNSLLHADVAFWQTHPAWRDHLAEVLMGLPSVPEDLTIVAETFVRAR